MKKQYIKSTNEAPKLSLGTITFWYMAIKYFEWPDWALGVWGVISLILAIAFFVRLVTEESVDVVKR